MSCRHKVYLLLLSSREIVVSKTILITRTVIVMMTIVKCWLFIVTEITAGSDRAGSSGKLAAPPSQTPATPAVGRQARKVAEEWSEPVADDVTGCN